MYTFSKYLKETGLTTLFKDLTLPDNTNLVERLDNVRQDDVAEFQLTSLNVIRKLFEHPNSSKWEIIQN